MAYTMYIQKVKIQGMLEIEGAFCQSSHQLRVENEATEGLSQ